MRDMRLLTASMLANIMPMYASTGDDRPLYTGNATNRDPEPGPEPETRQQRRYRERREAKSASCIVEINRVGVKECRG